MLLAVNGWSPPFRSRRRPIWLAAVEATVGAQVPVVAPKLALGETLGAGGALGMAAAVAWLSGVPVTPNLVVHGEAPAKVQTVPVTTMGYYGNASAVVMRARLPQPAS